MKNYSLYPVVWCCVRLSRVLSDWILKNYWFLERNQATKPAKSYAALKSHLLKWPAKMELSLKNRLLYKLYLLDWSKSKYFEPDAVQHVISFYTRLKFMTYINILNGGIWTHLSIRLVKEAILEFFFFTSSWPQRGCILWTFRLVNLDTICFPS